MLSQFWFFLVGVGNCLGLIWKLKQEKEPKNFVKRLISFLLFCNSFSASYGHGWACFVVSEIGTLGCSRVRWCVK